MIKNQSPITSGQVQHVLSLFKEKGVTKERCTALIQTGLLSDLLSANPEVVNRNDFQKVLRLDMIPGLGPQISKVTINYDLKLEDMIIAGCYDSYEQDILEVVHEKLSLRKTEGTVELVPEFVSVKAGRFSSHVSYEKALETISQRGLRPGTCEELLSIGTLYPELQREFSIVALGSRFALAGEYYRVPALTVAGTRRTLNLWYLDSLSKNYKFLAFPK